MSAINSVRRVEANDSSMDGWRGLHRGMIPCYRTKKRHAQWRWGRKKGLRRARRRLERKLIQDELENHVETSP